MSTGNVLAMGGCRLRSCRAWLLCSMLGDLWSKQWCLGSVFVVRLLKAPAGAFCCLRFALTPVGRSRVLVCSAGCPLVLLRPQCSQGSIVSLALLHRRILGLHEPPVLVQCRKSVLCDPSD